MGRRPSDNPSPAAIRQKRYRERWRDGVSIWPVEVSEEVKAALKERGEITDEDLANPDDLAMQLGEMIRKYAGIEF